MSVPASYNAASATIAGLFATAWTTLAPALNGGQAPRIDWEGVDLKTPPPLDQVYAAFQLRHKFGRQTSLGGIGARRFGRLGLVQIQIFVPVTKPHCLTLAGDFATIARDAYEGVGTPDGIWFRNVDVKPIGTDAGRFQTNVVAEFNYDQIK